MTVSAIDIGSNSVRLLTIGGDGGEIRREVEVTGLARGVDASGMLSSEAVVATEDVLARFARLMARDGSDAVGVVATSASRDAINGPEAMARFERILGAAPEVIGGGREAVLAFAGATAAKPTGRHVVVDIGGGSTEIIAGEDVITWSHSYDIGSVRLTDRCGLDHPASDADLSEAREAVAAVFSIPEPAVGASTIVGVAGTFTSIAGIVLGLDRYDRSLIDGIELSIDDVDATVDRLANLALGEVASIPSLDPRRASVILGGTIVASAVMSAVSARTVVISEHDLLDGLAAEVAARR